MPSKSKKTKAKTKQTKTKIGFSTFPKNKPVSQHQLDLLRFQGILEGALVMYGAAAIASLYVVMHDFSIMGTTAAVCNIIAGLATAHAADQNAKKL